MKIQKPKNVVDLSLILLILCAAFSVAQAQASEQAVKDAIAALTQKIAAAPSDDVLYAQRANHYFALNKLDEALADANQALNLNPKSNVALIVRAGVKSNKKDFDGALADYSEVIRLYPTKAYRAYFWRGEIYEQKGDFDSAMADYRQAADLNDEMTDPMLKASARIEAKKTAGLTAFLAKSNPPDKVYDSEKKSLERELTASLQSGNATAPINLTAPQKKRFDDTSEKYEKTLENSYAAMMDHYLKIYKAMETTVAFRRRNLLSSEEMTASLTSPAILTKRKAHLEETIPQRIFVRETLLRGLARLPKFNDSRWDPTDKAAFEKAIVENNRQIEIDTRNFMTFQRVLSAQKP